MKKTPATGTDGFTFIEMLVSMTIIALIVSITIGALHAGRRSLETGEKKIDKLERLRSSLSILDSQLQSYMPLTYIEDGTEKPFFTGEKRFLRFATSYSVFRGVRGNALVEYRAESANGGYDLNVMEGMLNTGFNKGTKLLEGFGDIYFEYLSESYPGEGFWIEEWTEEGVPRLVRLHILGGRRNLLLYIVIRVRET
jgi:prepilin-type N-terminal cleavage/methylation domain-containing protein